MKLRVFYGQDCQRCKIYIAALKLSNLEFILVDADASENESLCDNEGIDEIPHTQIMDGDKVLLNMIGVRTPDFIRSAIKDLQKK